MYEFLINSDINHEVYDDIIQSNGIHSALFGFGKKFKKLFKKVFHFCSKHIKAIIIVAVVALVAYFVLPLITEAAAIFSVSGLKAALTTLISKLGSLIKGLFSTAASTLFVRNETGEIQGLSNLGKAALVVGGVSAAGEAINKGPKSVLRLVILICSCLFMFKLLTYKRSDTIILKEES